MQNNALETNLIYKILKIQGFSILALLLSLLITGPISLAEVELTQTVTFCRPNNMVSALLYIAEAKGFFIKQGINPKFETATNAKICQDMLLARKADYMMGAEAAYSYIAASNTPIKILAMVQQNPESSIFARKDRGITRFEDLKGKRIAYLPGNVSYFFLKRAMKKYDLKKSEIELSIMQPPTMPIALVGGSIDAFSLWEPWGSQAVSRMPNDIINLTDPDLYQYESLFTGHQDAIKADPQTTTKILLALIDAEHFIQNNNDEAFQILSKAITFEVNAFKRLWPNYKHHVLLQSKIIKLLEEDFKLLQEDDKNFSDLPSPDFKALTDSSFLKEIDPSRVEF